jgi:glutamate 5-kinase
LNCFHSARRVVVKIGTTTLTYETGRINLRRIEHLVKVLSDLANSGKEIILVSSGAISVGCSKLGLTQRPKDTPSRQAAAAVGQCELMNLYDQLFLQHHHNVAQLLLTKDVTDDATRRQHVVNTFLRLLEMGAIPIVNENDTVAVDELEGDHFGDNDSLSALVAQLCEADALVILSDIDGLYDSDPNANPGAKLIPLVKEIDARIAAMACGSGSNRGTGGMATKIQAAKAATESGIATAIINGNQPDLLYQLFETGQAGTIFPARPCPGK